MVSHVAVLGCGNGGLATSAHLAMKGFTIALFEHPRFAKNIVHIKEKRGIEVTGTIEGMAEINLVTTEISQAIEKAEVIIVVVPAFAQSAFFELMLPHLKKGQTIILNPGNHGALELYRRLIQQRIQGKVLVAETASLIYACIRDKVASVRIDAIKKVMPISAIPSIRNSELIDLVKELYSQFILAKNVLETSFSNFNFILHPTTTILNSGWIESTNGNFDFYRLGMSKSVCRILEKLDAERKKVGRVLKLDLISTAELFDFFYGIKGKDIFSLVQKSPIHGGYGPSAPNNLFHRYVTEDVPFGLVPLSSFGKLTGVPTKLTNAVIRIACSLNNTDYNAVGRTAEKLGLANFSLEKISKYVTEGAKIPFFK
ncbi:MAG: NAD/NADP octopine/nopaline dehydrogenase family protein [Candidatus Bathyarchaeota archaeon]|nr:NAD/NADP octopine/nopaline dehydrogenase family protein [Candidatus Bathyarchaeota archaeon]MDH5494163.1 NAD/NADP octopine/nopaline dehydrogenase family protein [Candidatus Bathyarchaeota archaeon]